MNWISLAIIFLSGCAGATGDVAAKDPTDALIDLLIHIKGVDAHK